MTPFKPTPLPEEVKLITVSLLTTKTIGIKTSSEKYKIFSDFYNKRKRQDIDAPVNTAVKIVKRLDTNRAV